MVVKSHIAYKLRLYPTKEQCQFFMKSFGCSRFIWNRMLEDKMAYTPAYYKQSFPWLCEVDSLSLSWVQLQLSQALNNHRNNPKYFGYPKFKSKHHSKASYSTSMVNGNIKVTAKSLKLPKLKTFVKMKTHRVLPDENTYKLKSVTVSMEKDGTFYASLLYEYELQLKEHTLSETLSQAIGLDYKSDGFCTDSFGRTFGSDKFYRKSERKIAKLQHRLSRKQKGSVNYNKVRQKLAKAYLHTANQRKDCLHKLSYLMTNRYNLICIEDLNMKSMSNHGFGNGKATLDNGFGMFVNMLEYKGLFYGCEIVKVNKWYPSSQICHVCGYRNHFLKDLSIRKWECPVCHAKHDRDYNAAINIRKEGIRTYIADFINN